MAIFAIFLMPLNLFSQERTNNFNITLIQMGKIKSHEVEVNDTSLSKYTSYKKMRSPYFDLYWQNDLFFINASAYSVFMPVILNSKSYFGNALALGWGWQTNRDKPIKLWSNCNAQFGFGFNLGLHVIRSEGDHLNPKIVKNTVYIGPTAGLNIQLGKKLNIQNVIELTFGPFSNQRIALRSNFNYLITKSFGLCVVGCLENIFQDEEEVKTIKGVPTKFETDYAYRLRHTQVGFVFVF